MAVVGGLQKARVLKENLPPLSIFPDGSIGHYVRYRVVSEDRNRYSHWSPVYLVKVAPFTLMGSVSVSNTPAIVSAVWGDALDRPRYDVFVRWGNIISKVSSSGTTRTIETSAPHGFTTGDKVDISNTTANYNGTWIITGTPTTTKFTFTGTTPQTENNHVVTGYVAFANYDYHGTPSVHNYSFMRTGTTIIDNHERDLSKYQLVHVDIQVESIDKIYNTDLLVYDTPDSTGYLFT